VSLPEAVTIFNVLLEIIGNRLDRIHFLRYSLIVMVEAMIFPVHVQKNDEESLAAKG
jgi:hypothetical protein